MKKPNYDNNKGKTEVSPGPSQKSKKEDKTSKGQIPKDRILI